MSEPLHRLHTLPPRYHSDETGVPFDRCCDCGKPAQGCEAGYLIQKAYAHGEVIMEMAVCWDCHKTLQSAYSKESRDRIWNFYLDHGDLPGRLKKFHALPVGNPDVWIQSCMTCGADRDSLPEYVVAAHVYQGSLVYGETPMMICFRCMNQIVEMLSEASRDVYDEWMDRVLSAAPESLDDRPRIRVFM